MVYTPSFFSSLSHAKLAAGLTVGLAALLAATLPYAVEPAPRPAIAVRVASDGSQSGLRSYAYFPEQLAALSSMSNFHPVADPGVATEAKAVTPEARPIRRPEGLTRPSSAAATQAAPVAPLAPLAPLAPSLVAARAASPVAVAPQKPAEPDRSWRILGLRLPTPALPDAQTLRRPVDGLREAATGVGDKILHFWR